MHNFDIQFHNTRIRGIYEFNGNIQCDVLEAAIAFYAAELVAVGMTAVELCTSGRLLAYKIKLMDSFDGCDIYIRVNDVTGCVSQSKKPALPQVKDSPSIPNSWICLCGNQNTGNFCTFCGAKRQVQNKNRCVKCGHKVHSGDNYCAKCGHKLSKK